ncbi:hypothetical protein CROQUDRAFT_90159 [Cronartium quercuum f. sp. fusiforme G11]|uniref:Uncharacterized protein n=1 Tax=Cronartium quercuum f. sp. fusiforme G11 TaxID=708437 RepID=A0A9P6NN85_9BASI|nr:hypothetical protein CROQUDRAFT_90159 [Cronartium quercuum f. sp. fusiforme G11]
MIQKIPGPDASKVTGSGLDSDHHPWVDLSQRSSCPGIKSEKTPVGYVRKALEEIGIRFLIRSVSGSPPSLEVCKTFAGEFSGPSREIVLAPPGGPKSVAGADSNPPAP